MTLSKECLALLPALLLSSSMWTCYANDYCRCEAGGGPLTLPAKQDGVCTKRVSWQRYMDVTYLLQADSDQHGVLQHTSTTTVFSVLPVSLLQVGIKGDVDYYVK